MSDITTPPPAAEPQAGGTPAAPAPPASTPDGGTTTRGAVLDAIAARRAELGAGTDAPGWTQPRNPDGTFASPAPQEQSDAPAAQSGEPATETEAAPSTDPAAPAESAPDDPASPPEIEVQLPGRRAEDGMVSFKVTDPELAERIRQLNNGYVRGEEIRAREAELAGVRHAIEADPVGFFTAADAGGRALIDAGVRRDLVMTMLAEDPQLYERVVGELADWDRDENLRRAGVAELRAARATRASDAQHQAAEASRAQAEEASALERTLSDVVAAIDGLCPAGQDPVAWRDAALDRVSDAYQQLGLTREQLTPQRVRYILQTSASAPGAPAPAAAAPTPAPAPAAQAAASPPASTPATEAAPRSAAEVGRTLVEARERRESAATVSTPGAGAAPLNGVPPAGQSVKERIAWARQNGAFGR